MVHKKCLPVHIRMVLCVVVYIHYADLFLSYQNVITIPINWLSFVFVVVVIVGELLSVWTYFHVKSVAFLTLFRNSISEVQTEALSKTSAWYIIKKANHFLKYNSELRSKYACYSNALYIYVLLFTKIFMVEMLVLLIIHNTAPSKYEIFSVCF